MERREQNLSDTKVVELKCVSTGIIDVRIDINPALPQAEAVTLVAVAVRTWLKNESLPTTQFIQALKRQPE